MKKCLIILYKNNISVLGTKRMCVLCNKLIHKSSLRRHMRTVHAENCTVECPDCMKVFKNVESLDTHQRTVHRNSRSITGI